MSAEFPDEDHPARRVAAAHKNDLRNGFTELARRMRARDPELLGLQLALLVNGGFSSSSIVKPAEALRVLAEAADALLVAHGVKTEARKRR